MSATELSLSQIYNLLLAGKKLKLPFQTAVETQTFLTRLHNYRTKESDLMVGLGAQVEEDKPVIRTSSIWSEGTLFLQVELVAREPRKKYSVEIVEDDSEAL